MKFKFLFIALVITFYFSGCNKSTDKTELVYENNKFYSKESLEKSKENPVPFTGTAITKHSNGKIKEKITYKNGLVEGSILYYNENGKLKSKFNFKSGLPHGEWIVYDENGKISNKTLYENGLRVEKK